jgi:type I restriction enzyme, S subunit
MEVTSGYKTTEVGVIPDEWSVSPLGEICSMKSGEGITSANIDMVSRYPCFGGNGLRGYATNFTHDGRYVLIGRQGALCGNVVYVEGKFFATEHAIVVTSWVETDNSWLSAVLSEMKLNQYSESSAQPGLSVSKLLNLKVAFPPTLAEQEAIAEALSDSDAFIESLEQLIAKKRQIKQGAMQELLTGKRRLPGFSGEWETRSLLDIADGKRELFNDGDWIESEHIANDGIRLVQTGNIGVGSFVDRPERKYISESSFQLLRCKEIVEGDLLVCRLAEPAGRACVLPNIGEEKSVTSVDVTIFRPQVTEANRIFLSNLFSTDEWFRAVSDRSGGTTHKRIARGALGEIEIKLPNVKEQDAITEILADMDKEIINIQTKLTKARKIKQGMMQELLTGKIRLI